MRRQKSAPCTQQAVQALCVSWELTLAGNFMLPALGSSVLGRKAAMGEVGSFGV